MVRKKVKGNDILQCTNCAVQIEPPSTETVPNFALPGATSQTTVAVPNYKEGDAPQAGQKCQRCGGDISSKKVNGKRVVSCPNCAEPSVPHYEMEGDQPDVAKNVGQEQWGVGSKAGDPAYGVGKLDDGGEYELIHGEHPHSRRDERTYARMKNGPIYAFDGHRPCVDIAIKSFNYLKSSHLSGEEIRKGGEATISFDGRPVYKMFVRDPLNALHRIREKTFELLEHPIQLWDEKATKGLEGRPVYYQGTPAYVMATNLDRGSVTLRAADKHVFPTPVWMKEDPDDGPPMDEQERVLLEVDILSKDIWWWRKDGTMGTGDLASGGAINPLQGAGAARKRKKRVKLMESRVKHKARIDLDLDDEED
jgi:hypothetical protein